MLKFLSMRLCLMSMCSLVTIMSIAGPEILSINESGKLNQKSSLRKIDLVEGEHAVHWSNMESKKAFNVYNFDGNLKAATVINLKIYSMAPTGQVIYLAAYSENPTTEKEDYYKLPFTVDWTGWKTVSLQVSDFKVVREPVGWESISAVRLASHWSKDPKPGTDIYIQSIVAAE